MCGLYAAGDYEGDRYKLELVKIVEGRALYRRASMWEENVEFYGRPYKRLRQDGGKELPVESGSSM